MGALGVHLMNESVSSTKFLLCLGVCLGLLGNWPAAAADLAVKAQPRPRVALTYTGSGWYGTVGTFAEMDRATVEGPQGVAFSGFTAGGSLVVGGGYMWGDGTTWKAIEILAHYQNIGDGSATGTPVQGSVSSKLGFTERFLLGGPLLAALQGLVPAGSGALPVLPVLPAGTAGAHPYVFLAAHQDDVSANYAALDATTGNPVGGSSKVWRIRGGAGMGVQTQFTPTRPGAIPVTMDVWVEYLFAGSGLTLGNTGGVESSANMGAGARTGVLFKY